MSTLFVCNKSPYIYIIWTHESFLIYTRCIVDIFNCFELAKTQDVGKIYELIRRCSYQPDEMVELVMPFGAAGFGNQDPVSSLDLLDVREE